MQYVFGFIPKISVSGEWFSNDIIVNFWMGQSLYFIILLAPFVLVKTRGLQRSKQPPPLPLGEGWGEGKYVILVGLPPHPNPLPKGRGDFAILVLVKRNEQL